jgi:hypothetical protein
MHSPEFAGTLSDTVLVLREERRRAVDSLQFDTAKEIEIGIRRVESEMKGLRSSTKRTTLSRNFEIAKESVRRKAQALQFEYQSRLFAMFTSFQPGYIELNESYSDQMIELSARLVKTMELAVQRTVPEATTLFRAAEVTANVLSKFEEAEQMTLDGVTLAAQTLNEREGEIRHSYDVAQAGVRAQHREEMKMHQERLQNALSLLQRRYDQELGVLKQMYRVNATKYGISIAKGEIDTFFFPQNFQSP